MNTTWDIKALADLYVKSVGDNDIFTRVSKHIFTQDFIDRDLEVFLSRSTRVDPWIFRCDKTWYIPTPINKPIIRVYNQETPYVNFPDIAENKHELLIDIISDMYKDRSTRFYRIFIKPLIDVCTTEELFKLYQDYTYSPGHYKFNPDIPLPRDIELISANGHIIRIHKHVAVSVGEYLPKRILNWACGIADGDIPHKILDDVFKPEQKILIPCQDTTLEWLVSCAYKGVYTFGKAIDKLDALDTLDFLLIVKKETIYDEFMAKIRAKCE